VLPGLLEREERSREMHTVAWWPTVAAVLIASGTDLYSRKIPNWLVAPYLLAGLVVSVWFRGWYGGLQSLEGMALGLVVFGVLYWMGGMGAGDVKLCAAIGAWVGPSQMVFVLVMTALAGGLMALVWAVAGGFLGDLADGSGDLLLGWRKRGTMRSAELSLSNPLKRKMPYAPAIAIGTLMSFFAR